MLYTFGCHIIFTRLLLLRYVPLLGAITGTSRGDIRHFSGRYPALLLLCPLSKAVMAGASPSTSPKK